MQTVASIQTITKHPAQPNEYPHGLRPEFDVWSVPAKKVIGVKYMHKGFYALSDIDGPMGHISYIDLLSNLETGLYATLQVNHDQQ